MTMRHVAATVRPGVRIETLAEFRQYAVTVLVCHRSTILPHHVIYAMLAVDRVPDPAALFSNSSE
jgi:hypothetical protein